MNTMMSVLLLSNQVCATYGGYLNLLKKIEQISLKFFCCTHTKQSKASIERFQSSVTHSDPSETLQESSSRRSVVSVKMLSWDLHAGGQERTLSRALAGVDLNPQPQHKTSKTDKSVIDHWSIVSSDIPLQPATCMCVCVLLEDKAAVNTPTAPQPACAYALKENSSKAWYIELSTVYGTASTCETERSWMAYEQ